MERNKNKKDKRIGNTKNRTHGLSKSRAYNTWKGIKRRCFRKQYIDYHRYGGRGITVCKRWMKFENFFKDMGEQPEGMSLDRIDNDGDYKPSNCRWATRLQQCSNTRQNVFIEYKGVKKHLREWERVLGISITCIRGRLKRGWSAEKIIETPSKGNWK